MGLLELEILILDNNIHIFAVFSFPLNDVHSVADKVVESCDLEGELLINIAVCNENFHFFEQEVLTACLCVCYTNDWWKLGS